VRDVGVVEARQHLRFPFEARETLRVGCEVRRQHLERHLAPQLLIGRAPHLAHPARTERLEHLVTAEPVAARQAHELTRGIERCDVFLEIENEESESEEVRK